MSGVVNLLTIGKDKGEYIALKTVLDKLPDRLFRVDWCSSVAEAKQYIQENRYDLYIVDYDADEEEAKKLLEVATPYARKEPFIILTKAYGESMERQVMKLGVADYLEKRKFNVELLSRTLRYALQRKQMEEQRLKHLIDVNRTKDEFISLASHQLRTPATGVKQYLGMLLEGFVGELKGKQKKAYASNERQLRVVSELLRVAQVDAGKVRLSRKRTDVVRLVEDILSEQGSLFEAKGQKVSLKASIRPIEIRVDTPTIRMVIENIIDNASKYSYEGQHISISIKEERGVCTVSVRDEGVGISREDKAKLFQKFTRINNPLSTMVGGSGLGLYWAKKIVDLHSGEVCVSSRPNKGSTFTIVLPGKM